MTPHEAMTHITTIAHDAMALTDAIHQAPKLTESSNLELCHLAIIVGAVALQTNHLASVVVSLLEPIANLDDG